jgi:hypothetical protein
MPFIHPGVTGRKGDSDLEPLSVSPRQACFLLGVGNTRLYQLIRGRELSTYHEGRARRITVESIRARSHGARSLYVALRRRYFQNSNNNDRIYLSQRDAVKEVGSHHNEIARWFRELQFYGFIVMTKGGSLGVEGKGKAPHWRLTELGYMTDLPTRDFERWRGAKFVDRKTKPRAPFPAHSVREMAHTQVREMAHTNRRKRDGNGAH